MSATDRRRSREDYPHPSSPAATIRMRANRSRDTSPELALRSALHRAGLRFRVNFKVRADDRRPISVDIAFPRRKVAVFVDGCFWHGCKEHRTIPVANRAYWAPKIEENARRD